MWILCIREYEEDKFVIMTHQNLNKGGYHVRQWI